MFTVDNMASTATESQRAAREARGQEARKLLNEMKRLEMEMRLDKVKEENKDVEMYRRATIEMKNFVVENEVEGGNLDWNKIKGILVLLVQEDERRLKEESEVEIIRELVRKLH
ncbi:hypothetical protein PAEPH01_2105, partial [Pancytospora epiphaga]